MLALGAKRSRHNVKFDETREIGRLVAGEHFECKKSEFKINTMLNW
jgi:hypothetical protein